MHSQLLWIGAHITSFSVTALAQESFLVTYQPDDMELLAALVTGSPRLERLEFHRQTATRPVGLDAGTTPPADFNLDALLGALPPHRTCPPHLVLDGLRVQHMTTAHCLRGLQSLTLFTPRPRMSPHENDMWLAPLWSALGAAHVFPPCLAVDDLDSALIRYLAQHPGLEMLNLRWRKEFRGGHGTLAATFFSEVLPHHARTLRRLGLEFPEPSDPTLRDRAITQCVVLEAFSTHIVWIDRSDFAAALNKLLRVLSAIHGIRFLMLALALAHGKLTSEVKRLVRRAVQAHVIKDEMLRVPAEIVIHGNRFCITHVDTVRKYVLSGQVASEKTRGAWGCRVLCGYSSCSHCIEQW
ncbi:hypothetical protein BD779DRAFT_618985 [Infundibulicybe gibba]|nr:hypothetical protein BD779DRAFT_618985 [Infundibulicybe gibba]